MKKTYYIIVILICLLAFLGALYLRNTPMKTKGMYDTEIVIETASVGQGNDTLATIEQGIDTSHDEQHHDVGQRQEIVERLRDRFNPSDTMAKVGKEIERLNQIKQKAWIERGGPASRNVESNFFELRVLHRMIEEAMKNDTDHPVMFLFHLLVGGESDEMPIFPRTLRFGLLKAQLQELASKSELTDEDMEIMVNLIETNILLRRFGGLTPLTEKEEYDHELDHEGGIIF